MHRKACAAVPFLLAFIGIVYSEGHFSIVAPENIRPNSDYHVSVSLHDSPTPCDFRVGIEGVDNYRNTREIHVEPYTSQLVQIDTGYMAPGNYKLIAEGLRGVVGFRDDAYLTFLPKNTSILLQSDKAIYKPGDLVRFRVLVLDMNMKPQLSTGPIRIFITDGSKNRIKQWLDARPSRGVYSDELELSSHPVLGDWHITVEAYGETKIYKFEVAEYVLPKFDVSIETSKHHYYKDGKLRATIRSKYTYGRALKGEATVSVYPKTYGSFQPLISNLITRKVMKIDGKAFFEFDIKDELKFKEDYEQAIAIEAVVEEELTGRKQNTTLEIALHKSKYKIDFVKSSSAYKPGLPFAVTIVVSQFDGTPVADTSNQVIVRKSNVYNYDNGTETKHTLNANGMLEYSTIVNDNKGFSLKAIYLDAEEGLGWISPTQSQTGAYLQAILLTKNPKINGEVTVEVQSTVSMRYLSYQVLGRGDIIVAKTVEIPNLMSHTFSFLASFAMVPKAQVIVHYVKGDEIISDRLQIDFDNDLQNYVTVELSTPEATPGQEVDITVISKPNSYIGLMGIDQSVLLLREGNDLDQTEVFSELELYSKRGQSYGKWNTKTSADFSNAGTVLISNARTPEITHDYIDDQFYHDGEILDFSESHLVASKQLATIRTYFPETWLWHELTDISFQGRQTIHKKVPDSITSWVITGFALDPINGIGLTPQPKHLRVFKPFFVSLDLPYSVKRGEVLSVPIVVFNYMSRSTNAEVTLHNVEQDFEYVEMTNDVATPKIELYRRKSVAIKANDGAALSFMIRPKRVGPITIKVTATSTLAGDGIERTLQVEPEGVQQHLNQAVFVDLRQSREFTTNFTLDIPKNVVPDSVRIEAGAVGDLLGGSVKNLDKLIRLPTGCGEQSMLKFVPNIVVLDYLRSSNQLTPAVEARAKKYLASGYQRMLSFKHKDGSFSAFGPITDDSGSTWLTAFVARSFVQASKHIDIEPKIISDALQWLSKVQTSNGNFPEVGQVISSSMQGGAAGSNVALTAYVLVAFLEDKVRVPSYQNVVNKAIDYVARNLEGNDDLYSLAVASYALQLANHNSKNYILQTFDSRATRKGDLKWWEGPIPASDEKNIWYKQPNSLNVEMTAYGLLALLEAGQYEDGLPTLKWLLNQRNENGGFQSTQDTIVGLQALSKFAERVSAASNNVRITIKYNENVESQINVNADNSLILQTYELPNTVRQLNVSATGNGFALLQISYKYNVNVTGAWPRFTLDPQPNKNSNPDYLHLTVCTSFVAAGPYNQSNMAVMEVQFPSGFTADLDTLPSLEVSENVKKVETKDGDTVVVVYFEHIGRKEICPTLDAFRTHKVAMQKPAAVTLYDYYDNSRRARQFYRMRETSLCDICEGSDCDKNCEIRASEQKSFFENIEKESGTVSGRSQAPSFSSLSNVVLIVASTILFYLF